MLITLGIIGIVAAMTLPALIGNYKKQEVVTRLKKFYVTLNQGILLSVSENGPMEYWDFPEKQNNGKQMDEFVNKYLFPYFKGLKHCSSSDKRCDAISKKLHNNQPIYVFGDGGCFSILKGGGSAESGMMHLLYDINCLAKPNEYNRDIFAFAIKYQQGKTFVLKAGTASTFSLTERVDLRSACINLKNSAHSIGSCAALIYYDGWEIAEDYPYKL